MLIGKRGDVPGCLMGVRCGKKEAGDLVHTWQQRIQEGRGAIGRWVRGVVMEKLAISSTPVSGSGGEG